MKSRLRPTVLMAEMTSNRTWVTRLPGTVMEISKVAREVHKMDNRMMAYALLIFSFGICRLNISTFFFPFKVLKILLQAIVNVVVFIPPPVDKGDAPIHIRNIVRRMVGVESKCIGIILNPAVRGVAAPKNEKANFPRRGRSAR